MVGFSIEDAYNLGFGVASMITVPVYVAFSCAFLVLLYYDIRIRKEAINVDVIREAL